MLKDSFQNPNEAFYLKFMFLSCYWPPFFKTIGEDIAHTIYFTEKLSKIKNIIFSNDIYDIQWQHSYRNRLLGESIYEKENTQPPKNCNKGFSMDFGSIGHAK